MNIDELIFHALNHAGSNPFVDLLMVAVTTLGLTYIIIWIVPILWLGKKRELAFDAILLIVIADVVSSSLKLLFLRERPFEVLTDVHDRLSWGSLSVTGGYSMPSGHTTEAFAVATLLALGTRLRWGLLALGLAALIGLSRIYLGVHWPSDVLVGAALGALLALAVRWVGTGNNPYTKTRDRAIVWMCKQPGWDLRIRSKD